RLLVTDGWSLPSLTPPAQHAAAVVVRSGDPVQFRAGRRASLGSLGLVVGPHALFGSWLPLLPRLARDHREADWPCGLAVGLGRLGGLVCGLAGGLGVAAFERPVEQFDRQQQRQ